MSVDLQSLIDLEALDRAVAKLENSKMEYPRKVTEMEATLLEKKGVLSVAQGKLEALQKDITQTEISLEENTLGLDTSHDRLNLVKTNREYDAILLEITERKAMIEKDRRKKSKFADKNATISAEIEVVQGEYDEAVAELQPQIDDLKAKIGSIDEDIAKVALDRETVVTQVPAAYLEEYNRILERRTSGRVLSKISDTSDTCSHCYQLLNANIRKQAQNAKSPVFCENCGSLIVWQKSEKTSETDSEIEDN